MLSMIPQVFSLNSAPRETYKKAQRSPKYARKLQNEVHPCESLELVAILDAILDFEKYSIHQADFIHVMSEAAESSEKKTISAK